MTNKYFSMKFNDINVSIGNDVTLHTNVKVGDNSVIYDNAVIGSNTIICNDCVIGEPLDSYYRENHYVNPITAIGIKGLIRSHTIIYADNTICDYFITGHRATIREKCFIGHHCSVGTLCDIQGYSTIGNYCRLHSNVHICQKSKIGNFVFISPNVIFTNDSDLPSYDIEGPTIGDYTQIAVGVVIFPRVKVGKNCLLGANSVITKDVDDYSVVVGSPGKKVRDIRDRDHYPWMYHFERGMPWEGIGYDEWLNGT